MKTTTLNLLVPFLFAIAISCQNSDLSKKQYITSDTILKLTLDTLYQNTASNKKNINMFSDFFFKRLDSIQYTVDTILNENVQDLKSKKLSELFLYNFRSNYKDSVFQETIIELKTYLIDKKQIIENRNKKSRFPKGRIMLIELTLPDSCQLLACKEKYNDILNAKVDNPNLYLSRTFYDFPNNKLWFLYAYGCKITPELQDVQEIMPR